MSKNKFLFMFKYTVCLTVLVFCCSSVQAVPNLLFSDDFEGVTAGSAPDSAKWTMGVGDHVFVAIDGNTPDGSQVAILPTSGITTMRSTTLSSAPGEFWAEFYVDPNGTNPGLSVAFWESGAKISLTLIIYDLTNGTYAAWVNSKNTTAWIITTGNPAPQIGLERWVLGVVVTNPSTGEGKYTIYKEGVPLAVDVPFTPVSNTAITNNIVFYDQAVNHSVIDAVKIYDGDPENAKPSNCGDAGTVYKKSDFNEDCSVDFIDFNEFAQSWLKCTDPGNATCD